MSVKKKTTMQDDAHFQTMTHDDESCNTMTAVIVAHFGQRGTSMHQLSGKKTTIKDDPPYLTMDGMTDAFLKRRSRGNEKKKRRCMTTSIFLITHDVATRPMRFKDARRHISDNEQHTARLRHASIKKDSVERIGACETTHS